VSGAQSVTLGYDVTSFFKFTRTLNDTLDMTIAFTVSILDADGNVVGSVVQACENRHLHLNAGAGSLSGDSSCGTTHFDDVFALPGAGTYTLDVEFQNQVQITTR